MPTEFTILPKRWRGMRNNESAVLLQPDEWADSLNFDARFGWSRRGSTRELQAGPVSQAILLARHYYDVDGTLHRVWVNEAGSIFEDTTDIGQRVQPGVFNLGNFNGVIPYFAAGTGAAVVTRTNQNAAWKDPSDSVWKELVGPTAPLKGATFDFGGPRLFAFPGDLGPDSWAWSAVGNFNEWTASGGGGQEPIGNDREDIVAIEAGLETNIAIYKRNHIYMRKGGNPDTWRIIPVSNDIGLTAPNSVLRLGKSHFFVHDSGAYFLNAIGSVSFPSLTHRIQRTWDDMVDNFGEFIRFAHAAYHPRENTIYLWVPNQANRVMNRLIKIHVADAAITLHDNQDAGGSDFFPRVGRGQIEYGANSSIFAIRGFTDDGQAIQARIVSGIFSGSPPTFHREKRWGFRGILHLFFETEDGAQTVTVTPRAYRGNTRIDGATQNFTIPADQISKIAVKMGDESGWGIDFIISSTINQGRIRWLGYAGQYEEITDA